MAHKPAAPLAMHFYRSVTLNHLFKAYFLLMKKIYTLLALQIMEFYFRTFKDTGTAEPQQHPIHCFDFV
jgi:hypothetical protein